MSGSEALGSILDHLRTGGHLTLFLDYDGTLVPIAPTPAEALPDPALLKLLEALLEQPRIRTVILSGRPLAELRAMLPVPKLLLAGLYGVEMQTHNDAPPGAPLGDGVGSELDQLRSDWKSLASGLKGFLIEDKGQAIALHARWAEAGQASQVLQAARAFALPLTQTGAFRILDGDRYIEVAPASADKGYAVERVLGQFPADRNLLVGLGDDNKDQAAFAAIHAHGGLAIGVGHRYPLPDVDERLESPAEVRKWLWALVAEQ